MAWFGLFLLVLAVLLMWRSGWPSATVLLAVCVLGVAPGLFLGHLDAAVLAALPARVLGLLEHDLLQALALYALVGALLHHLGLAGALFGGLNRLLAPAAPRAAGSLAGLLTGTLTAPMNGSVGASVQALAHTTAPTWESQGLPPERRAALVALTSTLGVVVPPSLVLLLLGDAMMRAHTEGLNLARQLSLPLAQDAVLRIINTQDLMQAVLLPGALLLAGWMLLAAWAARRLPAQVAPPWQRAQALSVLLLPALIGAMLVAVAVGWVRAVEAAATAGLVLLLWGLASGRLRGPQWRRVLDDALALTGSLFALLVAATTLSLVLRAYGTDGLIAGWMLALQGHEVAATALALLLLLGSALVLDAFELIFLVVPIVMPPLLAQVADAAWVSALALLVLQCGFLLPPLGYAVVLTRGQLQPRPGLGPLVRALLPSLCWAAAVAAAVALWPALVHGGRAPERAAPAAPATDVDELMRQMSKPRQ